MYVLMFIYQCYFIPSEHNNLPKKCFHPIPKLINKIMKIKNTHFARRVSLGVEILCILDRTYPWWMYCV